MNLNQEEKTFIENEEENNQRRHTPKLNSQEWYSYTEEKSIPQENGNHDAFEGIHPWYHYTKSELS